MADTACCCSICIILLDAVNLIVCAFNIRSCLDDTKRHFVDLTCVVHIWTFFPSFLKVTTLGKFPGQSDQSGVDLTWLDGMCFL